MDRIEERLKEAKDDCLTGSISHIGPCEYVEDVNALLARIEKLEKVIEDYKEVDTDHKKLVRELDVALNGKDAAPQGSLCDIVAQVKQVARTITGNPAPCFLCGQKCLAAYRKRKTGKRLE